MFKHIFLILNECIKLKELLKTENFKHPELFIITNYLNHYAQFDNTINKLFKKYNKQKNIGDLLDLMNQFIKEELQYLENKGIHKTNEFQDLFYIEYLSYNSCLHCKYIEKQIIRENVLDFSNKLSHYSFDLYIDHYKHKYNLVKTCDHNVEQQVLIKKCPEYLLIKTNGNTINDKITIGKCNYKLHSYLDNEYKFNKNLSSTNHKKIMILLFIKT